MEFRSDEAKGDEMMRDAETGLKRGVGLFGIVSLGLGTAIGVSVFSILAPAASLAGPALLLSMTLAMIPMLVFGIVYAFMGAALPVTGASFEWPRRFIHPLLGFMISWMRIVGSTCAVIVLAMVLVSYLGGAADIPLKPAMFIVLVLVLTVNLVSVAAAALSQGLMLIILLVTCLLFAIGSLPSMDMNLFNPFLSKGMSGMLAAIPLMISLFLGIETATELGGEVQNPSRNIPLGITISIVLTALAYVVVAVVAIGVLGAEDLAGSKAPLLDAATKSLGSYGRILILVSATVAIGSTINATFMIMSRFLYAMAASGMLPSALAAVGKKSGVPYKAVIVSFLLCCLGLFMPNSLVFLFLAVSIPTILKYGATCLSAIMLLRNEPDLYENASFKPSRGLLVASAWLGIVLGVVIIALGWSADWRPYLLLLIWAIAGLSYYALKSKSAPKA